MTFIYKPKKGLVGRVYYKYMSYVVNSIYIDKFICFSKRECNIYSNLFHTDRKRFQFIPLGIDCFDQKLFGNIEPEPFVFSTGRSNRDYDFLISSLKDEKYEVHVACDVVNFKSNKIGRVKIDRNCFGDTMLKEMAKCKCVVITLMDKNISSGQLVILQAMQLGKPIIVTRSSGIEEYLEDGVNGILIENKKTDLLAALNRIWNDGELYTLLSMNSIRLFEKKFTTKCMARNIIRILEEIGN